MISKRDIGIVSGLLGLAIVNGWVYHRLITIGYFLDDAAYILGAQSLLHGSYRALYLPGHPPQLDYAPGLPLLLAPIIPWINDQWTRLLTVNAVLMGLAALLLWRIVQDWVDAGSAAAVALLFLWQEAVARLSGQLFPEPLFVFLLLLLCWEWKRQLEVPRSYKWIVIGLISGWASLTRPEGCILIAAVAVGLCYRRRWEAWPGAVGLPLLIYGIWVFRNMHAQESSDVVIFIQNITFLAKHPGVYLLNLDLLLRIQIAAILLGFPSWPGSWVGRISGYLLMIAAVILVVRGFVKLLHEQKRDREVLLAILVFLVARWIVLTFRTALDLRYGVVALGFLLLATAAGLKDIFHGSRSSARWLIVIATLITYGFTRQEEWQHLTQEHRAGRTDVAQDTLRWIRENTRPDDRFLGPAPVIRLYTGREGFTGLYAPDAKTYYSYMPRFDIRYVWISPADVVRSQGTGMLDHVKILEDTAFWTQQNHERFRLVYQNDEEKTRLYAVSSPGQLN